MATYYFNFIMDLLIEIFIIRIKSTYSWIFVFIVTSDYEFLYDLLISEHLL